MKYLLPLLLVAGVVRAGEPVDSRTVYRHETIEIRADGTSVDTLEHAERLVTDKAAREYAQVTIRHKPTFADFSVVQAYTLKPDGRRIPVPPAMIQEQRGRVSGISAASFDDSASTIIIFPDTAAGDTTVYKVRWTGKKPLIAGHFWLWRSFQRTWLVDDYRLTVSAPMDYRLNVETLDLPAPKRRTGDGRHSWTWRHTNTQKAPYERALPHPTQYGARIFVSSFDDYAAMARAQHRLWEGKAAVTPEIRALAERLVHGKVAPEERARKVYDWVRENIRYVALALDMGGWAPHAAHEVLARGSGDCKDHAVLLEALLAAIGIDSTPALIHTGALRWAPEPPQAEFNHVITYVPSLDVYLDSTESHAPYGVLPAEDRARPVLHLKGDVGIRMTPPDDEDSDVLVSRTRYTLHEDGSVDGEQVMTAEGSRQIELRRWYGAFNEYSKKNWIRDRLIAQGLLGDGEIVARDVAGELFEVKLTFHADHYFDPAAPLALDASAWHRFSPLLGSFGKYANANRSAPYLCGAYREQQEIEMVFPRRWQVALPAARELEAPDRRFRVSYRRVADDTVRITREYVSAVRGDVCAPERYAAEKPFFEAVMRDLRSQIFFSAPSATASALP